MKDDRHYFMCLGSRKYGALGVRMIRIKSDEEVQGGCFVTVADTAIGWLSLFALMLPCVESQHRIYKISLHVPLSK